MGRVYFILLTYIIYLITNLGTFTFILSSSDPMQTMLKNN